MRPTKWITDKEQHERDQHEKEERERQLDAAREKEQQAREQQENEQREKEEKEQAAAREKELVEAAFAEGKLAAEGDLMAFIFETENTLFRSHEDAGANPKALLVWNQLRGYVELPPIGHFDLMQRAIDTYMGDCTAAMAAGNIQAALISADYAEALASELDDLRASKASLSSTA
jgi:flagellar biosynthesis GTPase FlhF